MNFSFADKNSSCVLILSADNEEEAIQELKDKVKYSNDWRMEILDDQVNLMGKITIEKWANKNEQELKDNFADCYAELYADFIAEEFESNKEDYGGLALKGK